MSSLAARFWTSCAAAADALAYAAANVFRFAPETGRHRGLARRLVAARRRAVLVVPKGERPPPRGANWPGIGVEDAADDNAVGEHIVIVIVPLARRAGGGRALEDQLTQRRPSIGILDLTGRKDAVTACIFVQELSPIDRSSRGDGE
jgi:hypothetical protein